MTTDCVPEIKIPYICEHDIDLFLLEEFVASPRFLAWFVAQIGIALPVQLQSVAYSVPTTNGESDLEVFVKKGANVIGILIENKLDAILQPQQAERYRVRSVDYVSNGKCAKCYTVIVAPGEYFANDQETKGFEFRIDLEGVQEWFGRSENHKSRRLYIMSLLGTAIEKGCVGWKLVPDETVSEFWRHYWELASALAPGLQMPKPSEKPSTSTFIYFRPKDLPRNTQLVHKLNYGYIDLQFGGMGDKTAELRRRYGQQLGEGMYIDRAYKSGVIRIRIPEINVTGPFSDSELIIQKALNEATRLLMWYRQVSDKEE